MTVCQNNCNPGQLYTKLLDEVEKIKCWKVKVDSETVQKERRLQENKRTIETQRKAIQELQVLCACLSFSTLQHTLTPFYMYVVIYCVCFIFSVWK